VKMRDSDFDPGVRAIEIGAAGLRIAGRWSAAGDVIPSAQPAHGRDRTSFPSPAGGPPPAD